MSSAASKPEVIAAGAVVVRHDAAPDGSTGPRVLLVHRPHHDDWSFPKGKLDAGETIEECAVRELAEETGMDVTLATALPDQCYDLPNGRPKRVHYWVASVAGALLEAETFVPNDEVDVIAWAMPEQAVALLSYSHDRDLVDVAVELAAAG
ncbi:NUDIX hydrolase [Nocardioides yefusunii]|uniref:NUDIX hydrolase n=1 Tax=Nocardioides yefusunii TaxID=2500546 RepID=A0ABW1QWK3_9ACTN|nr:NUDIX hydrolase [Nocardioides yefusunii]